MCVPRAWVFTLQIVKNKRELRKKERKIQKFKPIKSPSFITQWYCFSMVCAIEKIYRLHFSSLIFSQPCNSFKVVQFMVLKCWCLWLWIMRKVKRDIKLLALNFLFMFTLEICPNYMKYKDFPGQSPII